MRVNRILDAVGNNELRLKVDSIDERIVLMACRKLQTLTLTGGGSVDRGAAMLMRVDTTFRTLVIPVWQ
jgi:hypothetical protein